MSTGDKVFIEILQESQELNKKMDTLLKYQKENSNALEQMAHYLRDYQSVVDFSLKDETKRHEKLLRELKSQFTKLAVLLNPKLVGAYRGTTKVISEVKEPVFTNSRSFLQYIAQNTRFGVSTSSRTLYRLGFRSNISTSAFQGLDEGFGSDPGSPGETLRVFSTSANDTSAGTGIQRVTIAGIASTGLRANEQVTMAGTTRVSTTTSFQRIDFFSAIAVGTDGGGAAGAINLTNAAETTTFAQIATGQTVWRGAKLNVDSTQLGFIHQWSVGAFKNAIRFELAASPQTDPTVIIPRASISTNDGGVNIPFPAPIIVQQNGRILVRAIANGAVNEGTTQFVAHVQDP